MSVHYYNSLINQIVYIVCGFMRLERHFCYKIFILREVDYEAFVLTFSFLFYFRNEPNLPALTTEMSFVKKVKCHKEST